MTLSDHFRMLSRYNRLANIKLYAACSQLDPAEYRLARAGSFGSIHGLLNHILVGDRRWMGLFEEGLRATPRLAQILYEDFAELRAAREREDSRIEAFFDRVDESFWSRSFGYTNSAGKDYIDTAPAACAHLFNHQTHHRGQVHVMLSQTPVAPPSLDMHRTMNP